MMTRQFPASADRQVALGAACWDIVCDMFDKTANAIFEAKGSGTRNSVRMAIGQLADYARFTPAGARRAVLLNERPRPDLEQLLESQGIAAVWRTESGFTDNVGGQLVD